MIKLNELQNEALQEILNLKRNEKIRITGDPGTGKTVLTNSIVNALLDIDPMFEIIALAPSHPAKFILRENIENMAIEVNTLQSHCNFLPKIVEDQQTFMWTGKQPASPDYVIIDEYSMMSEELWSVAKTMDSIFILIGDSNQFKPVGARQANLLNINTIELTEQRRRKETSSLSKIIDIFKQAILENKKADISGVEQDETYTKVNNIDVCTDTLFFDKSTVLIAATNDTVNSCNKMIKQRYTGNVFDVGDEMILQKPWWNFYDQNKPSDLKNGDHIIIKKILSEDDIFLKIEIEDKRTGKEYITELVMDSVRYNIYLSILADKAKKKKIHWSKFYDFKNELMEAKHIYTVTSWKTQGSTFDNVVIDSFDMSKILLWRGEDKLDMYNRAMYVGFSRARKSATIIV